MVMAEWRSGARIAVGREPGWAAGECPETHAFLLSFEGLGGAVIPSAFNKESAGPMMFQLRATLFDTHRRVSPSPLPPLHARPRLMPPSALDIFRPHLALHQRVCRGAEGWW